MLRDQILAGARSWRERIGARSATGTTMLHDGGMTEPVPTGKSNARMRQTVGDMVRSMAVVLAVVAALLLVTWRPDPDPVRVVDTATIMTVASNRAPFPILVPTLDDLRATSVRWEPTNESGDVPVWHIGYVTPDDHYLQLTQSNVAEPKYLEEQTLNGEIVELIAIDGSEWQLYRAGDETALVNMSDGVTTVVRGTGSKESLVAAVQSLEQAPLTPSE